MDGRMKGAVTLARIRGIPIRLHFSLGLIFPFLAIVFAGQFRAVAEQMTTLMPPLAWGAVVTLGLFASVLVHELAHSLVAIATGGQVRGITLLFIGGVSELAGSPPRPALEATMALAGPLASLVLGTALLAIGFSVEAVPVDVVLALQLLGLLNVILGLFNLLPAFPLDGGRVLRALLQPRLGRVRATRWAAGVGKVLAVALALVGLHSGDLLAVVVGGFVYLGAERERAGVVLDAALAGLRVRDAVAPQPPLVLPAYFTVEDAAERMLAARADAAVLQAATGEVTGAVTIAALRRVPAGGRTETRLGQLVGGEVTPVTLAEPLATAAARLAESGSEALAVVQEDGTLAGIVRRADIEREVTLRELGRPVGAALREPLATRA